MPKKSIRAKVNVTSFFINFSFVYIKNGNEDEKGLKYEKATGYIRALV